MNFGSDFMQHFFILEYKTLPTLESYHYGIVIIETSFSVYFIFFFVFFFFWHRQSSSQWEKNLFSFTAYQTDDTPQSSYSDYSLNAQITHQAVCIFVLFHLMLLLCCTLLSCLLFLFLYPLISGPLKHQLYSCKSYNHHPFIFLPLQTILHSTTSN